VSLQVAGCDTRRRCRVGHVDDRRDLLHRRGVAGFGPRRLRSARLRLVAWRTTKRTRSSVIVETVPANHTLFTPDQQAVLDAGLLLSLQRMDLTLDHIGRCLCKTSCSGLPISFAAGLYKSEGSVGAASK
jgi:hypothetical protein